VIGGYEKGSSIFNANAPEASHMFFGQAITSGLAGLFATHPPLDERIRRIDRYWEAQKAMRGPQPATALAGAPIAGFAQGAAAHAPPPRPAIEQAGQPTEAHIAYAHQLLEALPGPLVNAAHEPYSARALIYAMLVGSDGPVRQSQIELIDRFTDKAIAAEARKLLPLVEQLDPKARLPLVDVAIGTLAKLTAVQYADFAVNVDELVRADRRISLFEWVIQRVLVRHLEPRFRKSRRPMMKYGAIDPVLGHASSVLSAMAYIGHRTPEQAARAIEAGRRHLSSISLLSLEECGLDRLGRALDELALLAPKPKRTLLKAAAAVIAADHQVTIGEAELFRGIADSLGVPVPPLLPGQDIV
jgi:uncharacterized tellurite resistance protein B-like protein